MRPRPDSAAAIAADLGHRATVRQMAEDAATVATVCAEPDDTLSREELLALLVEARRLLRLVAE